MAFKVLTLLSVTGKTTTQTGTVAASGTLASGGTKPLTGTQEGCVNKLSVGISCTVTDVGSVTHTVEGYFGSTWIPLTPLTAFTVASSVVDGSGYRTFVGPVPTDIRLVATVAGAVTFACTATAIGIDN